MQHLVFRLLSFGLLLLWGSGVWAADLHPLNSQALAHCESLIANAEGQIPSLQGDIECGLTGSTQVCGGVLAAGSWNMRRISTGSFYSTSQFSGDIEHHGFCDDDPEPQCEDPEGLQFTHYQGSVAPTMPDFPASICVGQCIYGGASQPADDRCLFVDANNNGSVDTGEEIYCPGDYTNLGETCTGGETPGQPNDPTSGGGLNCQNTDCGPNPAPGGGGDGEPIGGDPLPGQDPPGGPTAPGADGDNDPSTPSGPGVGTGDVTGPGGVPDGERDIDCNPQSNPECGWTGSGTGSGHCESQPSCSGDPVQCAILYQNWAAMCYDGGEITNPRDCRQQITCEGDVLFCEAIAQQRRQYCDAFVGDGTGDLDVTDDADFDRDLREEAETVDLEETLDQSGFASGTCPAPTSVETGFGSVAISIAPFCTLAGYIKPMVVIAALIIGIMIVVGGRK